MKGMTFLCGPKLKALTVLTSTNAPRVLMYCTSRHHPRLLFSHFFFPGDYADYEEGGDRDYDDEPEGEGGDGEVNDEGDRDGEESDGEGEGGGGIAQQFRNFRLGLGRYSSHFSSSLPPSIVEFCQSIRKISGVSVTGRFGHKTFVTKSLRHDTYWTMFIRHNISFVTIFFLSITPFFLFFITKN